MKIIFNKKTDTSNEKKEIPFSNIPKINHNYDYNFLSFKNKNNLIYESLEKKKKDINNKKK